MKILFYLSLLSMCVLVSVWSPWIYINLDITNIFGIVKPEEISGLKVVTLASDLEIFIDNEKRGELLEKDRTFIIDRVNPGNRLITLKRLGETATNYWVYNKIVNFEKNTTVVMAFNIGPSEFFSEGHIIYAIKKSDLSSPTKLNIIMEGETGGVVQVNSESPVILRDSKYTTFISLEQQNKILVSKNGFESQEFTILPDTQEERDKFKEYDINVEIKLLLQPLDLIQI